MSTAVQCRGVCNKELSRNTEKKTRKRQTEHAIDKEERKIKIELERVCVGERDN